MSTYECTVCGKAFGKRTKLDRHLLDGHRAEFRLSPDVAPGASEEQALVRAALRDALEKAQAAFEGVREGEDRGCGVCGVGVGRAFRNVKDLAQHILTKHNKDPGMDGGDVGVGVVVGPAGGSEVSATRKRKAGNGGAPPPKRSKLLSINIAASAAVAPVPSIDVDRTKEEARPIGKEEPCPLVSPAAATQKSPKKPVKKSTKKPAKKPAKKPVKEKAKKSPKNRNELPTEPDLGTSSSGKPVVDPQTPPKEPIDLFNRAKKEPALARKPPQMSSAVSSPSSSQDAIPSRPVTPPSASKPPTTPRRSQQSKPPAAPKTVAAQKAAAAKKTATVLAAAAAAAATANVTGASELSQQPMPCAAAVPAIVFPGAQSRSIPMDFTSINPSFTMNSRKSYYRRR